MKSPPELERDALRINYRTLQERVRSVVIERDELKAACRAALRYLMLVRNVDKGHGTYNGDLDGVIAQVEKATSRKDEI
jgi:hypothetical protein